jgi:hypothetical protein
MFHTRNICKDMTMQRIPALLSSLALASMLAAPGHATPPPDEEVITVTGTVMDEKEARIRSRAHVAAVLGAPIAGQNARWSGPLCIAIVGVQPTTAVPVLERIEAVVRSAGAELAKEGCRLNVVVHFTADADADFAAIERKRPDLFEETFIADREKLRTPGLPVRWF